MVEKECVALAGVYKKDGKTFIELSDDCNIFELYGFLSAYVKSLEAQLLYEFDNYEGDN